MSNRNYLLMAKLLFLLLFVKRSPASVPIVIRIPLKIDNLNPLNQYIHTNRGFEPLSIQNLVRYTEIPPKFTIREGKKILLEEIRNRRGDKTYSGTFDAYFGRKRMI